MPTIAYITNQFPTAVEWYVVDEIRELRRRGITVIPCSARRVHEQQLDPELLSFAREAVCLEPLKFRVLFRAFWTCAARFHELGDLFKRVLIGGNEPIHKRFFALIHILLGLYYSEILQGRGVDQIHVHHGYFASWIALVAARLLGVPFTLTLHGSDLLLHANFMDTKLAACSRCFTVSEFNRRHIATHYPSIDPSKVHLRRLGVDPTEPCRLSPISLAKRRNEPVLLAVGRLHAVKNYPFLLQACYLLRECGIPFHCFIAGEGPERFTLEPLIDKLNLMDVVSLLGHVPHREMTAVYTAADLVVLTSRSEGIPLVLMEAMAQGKIVLAPAITGIPELIVDGKTGFLYKCGALEEFVWRVEQILRSLDALNSVRRAAQNHVNTHFNRQVNLTRFCESLVEQVSQEQTSPYDENPVLQQI